MYNLSSQLLEQYPFEVTAIQKGRGTYICTTSEGGKIIIGSFRGSKGRVEAIEHVLLRLKENGIEADEIIHTREGEILAQEVDEHGTMPENIWRAESVRPGAVMMYLLR